MSGSVRTGRRALALVRRNIRVMMIFKVSGTTFFFVPVMTLFWQENGLSLLEVMVLQAIFSVATVVLELPSGILADRMGRRRVLIAAAFMGFLGLAVYSIGTGFLTFLVAELLFAVWIALMSGADSALLYDSLATLNEEEDYTRIWGNIQFYSLVLLGLVNVLGGVIGSYDLRYTLYASIPFSGVALVASLFFVDAGRRSKAESQLAQMREVWAYLSLSSPLVWLLLYAGLVFALNQAGLWIYQPYFRLAGIDVVFFGVIFACYQIVAGFGGRYTYWLEGRVGSSRLMAMLILLTAGSSLLMGIHIAIYSFAFVFVHQLVRGVYRVLISDQINRRVRSEVRASMLSVQALAGRLVYAAIIPALGWLADVYTVANAFTVLGMTGLLLAGPVLWAMRRARAI